MSKGKYSPESLSNLSQGTEQEGSDSRKAPFLESLISSFVNLDNTLTFPGCCEEQVSWHV